MKHVEHHITAVQTSPSESSPVWAAVPHPPQLRLAERNSWEPPTRFSCGSQWNMPTPVVFQKFAGKKYYTNWMIIKLHDVYNSSIRTCLTYSIYLHVPYTKYPIDVYRALQGILSFQSDHLDSSMNNTDTLRWKGLWISWVKFSRESKTLNESGVYGWTGSSCLEWNGITTL